MHSEEDKEIKTNEAYKEENISPPKGNGLRNRQIRGWQWKINRKRKES